VSRPVFLFKFQNGTVINRMAASVRAVTAGGYVWGAANISCSDVEMSGESERDAVKVVLPLADGYANAYIKNPPDDRTSVEIYRFDRSDSALQFWWSGAVTMHQISGAEVTFRCESDETTLAQGSRPRIAMVMCPHAVYHGACRLNRDDFRQDVTLTGIDGAIITVTGHSGASFAGGLIMSGTGETRKIKAQTGGTMTLVRPLPSLAADIGGAVYLYPGCARTPAACASFANSANASGTNIENHGGFSWMLTGDKNPWGGSSAT
jgi:hypothetical protein